MTLSEALTRLKEYDAAMHAYQHAMSIMNVDGTTAAPKQSWRGRGETMAYLAGRVYDLSTAPENQEAIQTVLQHRDACGEMDIRRAEVLHEELEELLLLTAEEYADYERLTAEADTVWRDAKASADYALFAPYLEKLIACQRRLAERKDSHRAPYDVLLDHFEKGTSMAGLEPFFDLLRRELTPVVHEISARPPLRTDFLHRDYPIERQRELSNRVMRMMGMDPERSAIAETEHPYTDGNNKWDVRITTHYHRDDVASSLYSVIHEGGHALYELGVADELQFTCLGTGSSMGIHESQSRFYENIIGRSEAFCGALFPVLEELFPQQTQDVTARDFYLAVNEARPSLIRTEADELTYPMHIMVRYELEKRMLSGEAKVADLPAMWNEWVHELLGITVPNDREGILQDSHWAGGAFGYFPSYALGSAYGAQMLLAMERHVPDLWQQVAQGDLSPVTTWLGQRIHRYGKLKQPKELLVSAEVNPFDPQVYVQYLKQKFAAIYQL